MQTNTNQMVLAALVLGVLVHPLAAAAGIRAAYGEGAAKTWDEAQSQCQAWGGSLVKAEGALASRLAKIKCTDVLWVGAHEAPKTRGSDRARWRWISDASSVAASVWHDGEPNNYEGVEEELYVLDGRLESLRRSLRCAHTICLRNTRPRVG